MMQYAYVSSRIDLVSVGCSRLSQPLSRGTPYKFPEASWSQLTKPPQNRLFLSSDFPTLVRASLSLLQRPIGQPSRVEFQSVQDRHTDLFRVDGELQVRASEHNPFRALVY